MVSGEVEHALEKKLPFNVIGLAERRSRRRSDEKKYPHMASGEVEDGVVKKRQQLQRQE